MKERKTFFDKDNRLNRGYNKVKNSSLPDNGGYNKKFQHILPPVEIIEAYEDIYPGTLARIIAMAEREQKHQHEFELARIEANGNIVKRGQNLSLLTMLMICIAVTALVFTGFQQIAAIFGAGAFLLIGAVAIIAYKKPAPIAKHSSHKRDAEGQGDDSVDAA